METGIAGGGADKIAQQARSMLGGLDLGQTLCLRDLADLWRAGEAEIFATEGAAIGKAWKTLKMTTQASRMRLNARFHLGIMSATPKLVLFGDMRASLTTKGEAQEQRVLGDTITVAVDTARINRHDRRRGLGRTLTKSGKRRKPRGRGQQYPDDILKIHEEGTATIPARPMIGVPASIEAAMDARVRQFVRNLNSALVGTGL